VRVEARLEREAVWLTLQQMAERSRRECSAITQHVRDVFKEAEIDEESNVQDAHIPGSTKPVGFFDFDVVISIGYRPKSGQARGFQRATPVLRNHLLRGETLNERPLGERGLSEIEETLDR